MIGEGYHEVSATIPDLLENKVELSDLYVNFTSTGKPSSFGVDAEFPELGFKKTLKSSDCSVLSGKLEDTLRMWEDKYRRHLEKQHSDNRAEHVEELNREATESIEALEKLLAHTLEVDDAVDWNSIKRKEPFRIKPSHLVEQENVPGFLSFNSSGKPTAFEKLDEPYKEKFENYLATHGFFEKLFFKKKIENKFEALLAKWQVEIDRVRAENSNRESLFNAALASFEARKMAFEEEKQRDNEALENLRARYIEGDAMAIEEYCDLVLNNSTYPDYFPQNWTLEYRPDSRIVAVDYDLPSPEQMPKIESYKYVKSRDQITEKPLGQAIRKRLFESAIYQICIRTIHELFEADVISALDAVGFNGVVTSVNPATGREETKVIMSAMAKKDDFLALNLSMVDPKATFKLMKGVAAANLIDLTPIPPVIRLDKTDKRFIEGRDVVGSLDQSVNLAAMPWDDFEHLVRELFEKEFAANGGDVKVTQASADGGVDAVAFDPDPIRGGKIVIQAKRYTNVVGVAAVRDLYGTVLNEGATKGILVTTSDYGKDSYEFAKDKPLTLLNGGNLLSLLEKHGHQARINVAEAKKILGV